MTAQLKPQPDYDTELFLGVHRSAKGYNWYDRLDADDRNLALALSQRHDLPELLGRVLAARGATLETIDEWLNPALKNLMPDPSSVLDMDKGAARIADAMLKGQQVAIFGDYDVDGASSSSLIARFFRAHNQEARIYIPDRIFEGYGPNPDAINMLIDDGAELIITVDCGTTSFEALEAAKKRNIDVVIVDHHKADETLPDVYAVINPNRLDDLSGMGHLAAAGVVFLLLVATSRALRQKNYDYGTAKPPDLLSYLDIVALATICDVVPLSGLNRAYVSKGLQVMHHRHNVGLRALADIAALKSAPTPYHLGFVLGPRINAGGRIGEAGLGATLLSTEDELEAEAIAQKLDGLNQERKEMETHIYEEALSQADKMIDEDPDLPVLLTGSDTWHKGLVGLAASRLTERYRRPSCAICWDENSDEGTGSARSISGVDIGQAVKDALAAGLLVKGGGHAMAAGLTVKRDKFDELQQFFRDKLFDAVQNARAKAGLKIDGALNPNSVSPELIDLLERAGPYGMGNPTPCFVFPSHQVNFAKIVGEAHIRCTLTASDGSKINAISFRSVGSEMGDLLLNSKGKPLHIAGKLRRDNWGGREKIELLIDDVADPQYQ